MGVKVSSEAKGLVVVAIQDIFSYKDFEIIQKADEVQLKSEAKINCLILAAQFSGWGKDGDWGDLTFFYETDPSIGKIAIVAQEKHKDELLMFLGVGRRQASCQWFSIDQEDQARKWLNT